VGRRFYEGHREKIVAWKVHAVILYERWHWTPDVIEALDVEDFVFYLESARAIREAEIKAMS